MYMHSYISMKKRRMVENRPLDHEGKIAHSLVDSEGNVQVECIMVILHEIMTTLSFFPDNKGTTSSWIG